MKYLLLIFTISLNYLAYFNEIKNTVLYEEYNLSIDKSIEEIDSSYYAYDETFNKENYTDNIIKVQSEYNVNYAYTPIYKNQYFSRLRKYFLMNEFGTCAYVSMGMILSYYDTFWNDNTIYENADQYVNLSDFNDIINGTITNSPGVKDYYTGLPTPTENDSASTIYTKNYNYYDEITNDMKNLQAYVLFTYAEDLGLINLNEINAFSITANELKQVFDDYLEYEMLDDTYSLIYYSNESKTSVQLRNLAITYIEMGYPVILGANYNYLNSNTNVTKNGSHALVAYEYDSSNDIIYGHNGYYIPDDNEFSYCNIESFQTYGNRLTFTPIFYYDLQHYSSLFVLIPISGTHICSDNYVYNGESICPCEFSTYF